MPPDSILFRFFTMSSIFVKPITPVPNGDVGVLCSLKSFDVDNETTTYGAPSGEASIRTTINSFFIHYFLKRAYFTFRSNVHFLGKLSVLINAMFLSPEVSITEGSTQCLTSQEFLS